MRVTPLPNLDHTSELAIRWPAVRLAMRNGFPEAKA